MDRLVMPTLRAVGFSCAERYAVNETRFSLVRAQEKPTADAKHYIAVIDNGSPLSEIFRALDN